MKTYTLRRTAQSLTVLTTAMMLIFIIGRVLGDPVGLILGDFATPEVEAKLRAELGYDDPVIQQFGRFAYRVVTLDFGTSQITGQNALSRVLEVLPNTILLASSIIVTAVPIGFALGAFGAYRPGRSVDRIANTFALGGVSVVEFWLALTLILYVAVPLSGIPTGGSGSWVHLVLPTITGSFRVVGRLAQLSRSALLEEYGKPYVEILKAKGLTDAQIFGHVARNASIAIVTVSADELLDLTNGLVVVETVFGWPGIGRLIIRALAERDLFVLEAAIFTLMLIVLAVNFTIDLLYTRLNPKVRYE